MSFNGGGITMVDLIGPQAAALRPAEESFVVVNGLAVKTWIYRSSGSPNLPLASAPPIVAVHGGPAFTHNYMLPLKLITYKYGQTVIFYDQAGCGKSSRVQGDVKEEAPWLLTIEYYVQELDAVLRHYNLHESKYFIYGSSWGTVIAQEFMVHKSSYESSQTLAGLMLDGCLSDAQAYIRAQWEDRISTLPTVMQRIMTNLEKTEQYEHPMYAEIESTLGKMFTCRVVPRPDCFTASLEGMDEKLYRLMQGYSEFTIGGVLKDWSVLNKLHDAITVPTLVLAGEYDTMTEECSRLTVNSCKKDMAKLVIIPRASHCKLIDEPQICVEEVKKFVEATENYKTENISAFPPRPRTIIGWPQRPTGHQRRSQASSTL